MRNRTSAAAASPPPPRTGVRPVLGTPGRTRRPAPRALEPARDGLGSRGGLDGLGYLDTAIPVALRDLSRQRDPRGAEVVVVVLGA